jgi:hypothetical protein
VTTAQDTARQGMYAKLAPRDAVAHALTAYDRKMAHRKDHNHLFIGIALRALYEAHEDMPSAILVDLVEPFSGRLLGFLLKELGLNDRYTVGRRGDLEEIAS